jgi:TRAP-type C4-dicarboxylate transport system substrate-binding protein
VFLRSNLDRMTARHEGEWQSPVGPLCTTGRSVSVGGVEIFEFGEDRIKTAGLTTTCCRCSNSSASLGGKAEATRPGVDVEGTGKRIRASGVQRNMRRSVIGRALAAGLILVTALGAPGEVHAKPRAPTVLTMVVADAGGVPDAGGAFVKNVRRLSKGALLIGLRFHAQQTADGELTVIREVEQGADQMGWIPTRAWDAVGASTFAALQAPFLITNYALLRKVLEGPVGRGMLAGTRTAGIRTLGLAAVDLHVPLGARRPLVGPADFRGASVRVPSNSPLTSAILAALGGKAVAIASGPDEFAALQSGAIDGALTSLTFVLSNGYYGAANYLTANLVFFPYVGSFGINEQAFEALTPAERSILTKAAAETTRESFVGLRARDEQLLRLLCRTGLKIATSTSAQLAALRRAEQPVYASLDTNRATAARITKIQALKKKTKSTAPLRTPTGCAA